MEVQVLSPAPSSARLLEFRGPLNLILLEPGEVAGGALAIVTGARAEHMRRVLGVRPGQSVRIGLVDGPLGTGVVESLTEAGVALSCAFETAVPSAPRVDLLLAIPRPKVLRRLWAQLAALGVGRIILTNAEKVERPYFDTHYLEASVYRPLLIEGLQQARDTRVPGVSIHRRLKVLVEDELAALSDARVRLVADPSAAQSLTSAASRVTGERVLLAVGPEGGWNAFELRLLEAHGFVSVGLGSRILRTDTACVSLLAVLHASLDEARVR